MPRFTHSSRVCLLFLFLVGLFQDKRLDLLFTGVELARPPETGKDWQIPKSQLPEEWGSTVTLLLSYGFADPRGCEYREVELTCGTVWSNKGKLVSTHAWVLPQQDDAPADATRFAVTWSGLVYPVWSVGAFANLQTDVELQLKDPKKSRKRFGVVPEEELVSYKHPHLLKGCLLLILGETTLAEKMWNGATSYFRARRIPNGPSEKASPYFALTQEWAWAHFDHAVCAHMRGDYVLALDSAKTLLALKDTAGKEAMQRGFEPPFDFLHTIEVLAEDEARQAARRDLVRVLAPGAERIADPNARIAALIRDLETIDETQDGQPGVVSLQLAPVVKALVAEGEAAVEPLLQCLEHDQRLTRSVTFSRDFKTDRDFLTVSEAAFRALQGILKAQSFGPHTERGYRLELSRPEIEKREAVAKEIRDFHSKIRGTVDADRWYRILSDSQATEQQWLDAAQSISTRVPWALADAAHHRPLQGEPLRNRVNPSVSDLLVQRSAELTRLDIDNISRAGHLQTACTLTLCLSKWDKQAALPEIRLRLDQWRELIHHPNFQPDVLSSRNPFIPLIILAVDSGATEFLDLYAEAIKGLKPDHPRVSFPFEILRPLSRYPEHPKMAELAKALFSEGSPWRAVPRQTENGGYYMISSSLVAAPAFREVLKSLLDDHAAFGTVILKPAESWMELKFPRGGMGQTTNTVFNLNDPHLIEPKPVRLCDFTAWRLSYVEGAPLFEMWWPEAQRNLVLGQMKSFLDQWGNDYRDQFPLDDESGGYYGSAKFKIPKSTSPATRADVAAGLAIFSLDGNPEEVRTVDLPAYPKWSKWKTLKKFPYQTLRMDAPGGKVYPVKSFHNHGAIWQAEEILVDGRWQRYYGFVGWHIIAKVPVEEIEFVN